MGLNRLRGTIAVAVIVGMALGSAPGARAALYGIDDNLDRLYRVNPLTGAVTLVGLTGGTGLNNPAGLAWNGSQMYVIDLLDGELFTLDLNTGAPTLVGSTGIIGWQGLAARPGDGAVFAVKQNVSTLYSINPTTGAVTLIGGGEELLLTALAFDANGTLWTVEFSGELGTLDTTTGAYSSVAPTISGLQGLTFSANGTAYEVNTNTDSLYAITLTTGQATLVGAMTGTRFVKGLEFTESPGSEVPEPGSLVLLSLGALGLGGLRLWRRSEE